MDEKPQPQPIYLHTWLDRTELELVNQILGRYGRGPLVAPAQVAAALESLAGLSLSKAADAVRDLTRALHAFDAREVQNGR